MNEEMNLNNEVIDEVEDTEICDEPEEQESRSLALIVLGLLGIGATIGIGALIKKNKEKWAIKTLEKNGYKVVVPYDDDEDEKDQDEDEDSEK